MPYCDSLGRPIEYLRISITDRCNLRCVYCMPEEGVPPVPHEEILSYEELARLARVVVYLGINKLRLTGGEPLVRIGLEHLVAMLATIPGLADLSMTTNGTLLAAHAKALAHAGLRRVNVSLDTLRPERYAAMTRRGRLEDVYDGIAAAEQAGLTPIKINVVVIRGLNDDEVLDFAAKTVDEGWNVRFIEVMPLSTEGMAHNWSFVPSAEIEQRIEAVYGPLEAMPADGAGPARYHRVRGTRGSIGFISPLSDHFCFRCNRLRLTANGLLLPCLMSEEGYDVRALLRSGATEDELRARVLEAINAKPAGHRLGVEPGRAGTTPMSRIGG